MVRCGTDERWTSVMAEGQVWHDEMARWEKTGHLDQGPCWCSDCLEVEVAGE
jgi:hypothetical protein